MTISARRVDTMCDDALCCLLSLSSLCLLPLNHSAPLSTRSLPQFMPPSQRLSLQSHRLLCSRCLAQSCMQDWSIVVWKASIHALPCQPDHRSPPLGSCSCRCPCRGRPLIVVFGPPPCPCWPNLRPPSQQQSSSSLLWSRNDSRGGGCAVIVVAAQQWQRSNGSAAIWQRRWWRSNGDGGRRSDGDGGAAMATVAQRRLRKHSNGNGNGNGGAAMGVAVVVAAQQWRRSK